jgi:hypothetical protein
VTGVTLVLTSEQERELQEYAGGEPRKAKANTNLVRRGFLTSARETHGPGYYRITPLGRVALDEAQLPDAIKKARARMFEASEWVAKVEKQYLAASAELLRLQLLELSDKHPGLKGARFEVEFDYDHGYYFQTVTGHAIVDEQAPGQEAANEEHGGPDDDVVYLNPASNTVGFIANELGQEVDTDAGEYTVEVTIEKLREVSW